MDWASEYGLLSQKEREELRRLLGRLLAETFVVRRQEDRRDFYFIERNQALVEGYLKVMGWDLVVDKVAGVTQAVNRQGGTRVSLRLWDSILLLVLRLLYEEKRKQLNLTGDILCRVQEIHDKCLALKLRERGVVEKKYLRDAFGVFRRFSLVQMLDSDVTDPECRFLIYPSMLLAVPVESIQELHGQLVAYSEEEEESGEVADSDQAG